MSKPDDYSRRSAPATDEFARAPQTADKLEAELRVTNMTSMLDLLCRLQFETNRRLERLELLQVQLYEQGERALAEVPPPALAPAPAEACPRFSEPLSERLLQARSASTLPVGRYVLQASNGRFMGDYGEVDTVGEAIRFESPEDGEAALRVVNLQGWSVAEVHVDGGSNGRVA